MVVALRSPTLTNDSWRLNGCGERCTTYRVRFPGRRYDEAIICHDPYSHEAYGENVLAPRGASISPVMVETGILVIDGRSATTEVAHAPVHLNPNEWGILHLLAGRIGQVCTHTEILRGVWGNAYGPENNRRIYQGWESERHLLRVTMARLRARLGPARDLIETRPSIGYMLRKVAPVNDLGVQS